MRQIISHKYTALIDLYCSRYKQNQIMARFLEELLMTPFDDDILRMKVNIHLF